MVPLSYIFRTGTHLVLLIEIIASRDGSAVPRVCPGGAACAASPIKIRDILSSETLPVPFFGGEAGSRSSKCPGTRGGCVWWYATAARPHEQ